MMCKKCWGIKSIVTGGLLLLNAFVWPVWTGVDGWLAWIGVLMVLCGVIKLVAPMCPDCAACKMGGSEKASSKKGRK